MSRIFITGSTDGLGRAAAERPAQHGQLVMIGQQAGPGMAGWFIGIMARTRQPPSFSAHAHVGSLRRPLVGLSGGALAPGQCCQGIM